MSFISRYDPKVKLSRIGRQERFDELRPLNETIPRLAKELSEAEVKGLFGVSKPIQIQMVHLGCLAISIAISILVD